MIKHRVYFARWAAWIVLFVCLAAAFYTTFDLDAPIAAFAAEALTLIAAAVWLVQDFERNG